jgi:hypothetical protein
MPSLVFRKGLDLKDAVAGELAAAYHSSLVDSVRVGSSGSPDGSPFTSPRSSGFAMASTARSTMPIRRESDFLTRTSF